MSTVRSLGAALLAVSFLIVGTSCEAPGQTRLAPDSREQITLSFAPVVKRTAPAVVNVYSRVVVREQPFAPLFDDPFFRQFFGENFGFGMPRERVQNSLGSGVIVRADGLIVTNHHVIKGADQVRVQLADRREFDATVVKSDARTDLAFLRIDTGGSRLPVLELGDSDDLEVGDLVLAIGNPFGVGQTVTSGIVSALARTAVGVSDYSFFIQTDAAINPGNSGGALVSMSGKLIGINSAIYSRSGGSIGIGFAIPSNMVHSYLDAVSGGRRVVRPWLGFSAQTVTPDIAASIGLDRPTGVLVKSVDARSPAAAAGLQVGDVVRAVNGREVDDPEALRYRIATEPIGGQAALSVTRRGQSREVALPLVRPPETPPRETTPIRGRGPFSGATIANLSPALADELDFQGAPQGVIVLEVARGSPAAQIGFRDGDVVLSINEHETAAVGDVVAQTRDRALRWTIRVRRGDRVLTTTVRG
ncbi:MAG: Do family serine endopeptidase [Azospirillum sp.]|nr:Do family serine endopeptidase [Azospirillum sp.]